jgi:hypothetical protein
MRIPRKLAVAIVIAMLVDAAGAVHAGSACEASATVDGDGPAVDVVRTLLEQRGVGKPSAGCGVSVHIEGAADALSVQVTDGAGRSSQRTVASPELAATFVESWARNDLSAFLLAPPALALSDVLAPPGPAATPTLVRASGPREHALGIGLAGQLSYGSDDSLWVGAELSGCVRVRRLCVGLIARFQTETNRDETEPGELPEARRFEAALLLAIDLPYRFGPVILTPGVTAGVAWLHNGTSHHGSVEIDEDHGGLRTGGRFRLSIPLTGRLSLDAALALELSPLAQTEAYEVGGITIPPEPQLYLRGLAGLRWGEP